MRNKLQIEDIKNNIDEIRSKLKAEDNYSDMVVELMNDLERMTVKLLELC